MIVASYRHLEKLIPVERHIKKLVYLTTLLIMARNSPGLWAAVTPYDHPLFIGKDAYIDSHANSGADYNTWSLDRPHTTLNDWYRSTSSALRDYWNMRPSTVSIGEDVLEGMGGDLPNIRMTVHGLNDAKIYAVYLVYWCLTDGRSDWGIWTGIAGEPQQWCDKSGADVVFRDVGTAKSYGCQECLGWVSDVTEVSVDFAGYGTDDSNYRSRLDGLALLELDES